MKRATFDNRVLAYALLAPQLLITLVFFIWPAAQALYQSFLIEDAFGLSRTFVWFENFEHLFRDREYLDAAVRSFFFAAASTTLSMGLALLLAVKADQILRGASTYKALLVWPYAIAPAVAGVLWLFLFDPAIGVVAYALHGLGYDWNHQLSGVDAMIMIVVAAAWKQISYCFIFFLAGLQSIPKSLIEAAAIDGARGARRFWTIIFPLLGPTTFFLIVINVVFAFFESFSLVHATTAGGPAQSTTLLVYKVFNDGFIGLDLGSSAAQSVILMLIVVGLTIVQFRYVERRVHY